MRGVSVAVFVGLLVSTAGARAQREAPVLIIVEPGAIEPGGGGALVIARILRSALGEHADVGLTRPPTVAERTRTRDPATGATRLRFGQSTSWQRAAAMRNSRDEDWSPGGTHHDRLAAGGPSAWAENGTYLPDLASAFRRSDLVTLMIRPESLRRPRLRGALAVEPARWVEIDPRPERAAVETCVALRAQNDARRCRVLSAAAGSTLPLGPMVRTDRVVVVARAEPRLENLVTLSGGTQGGYVWVFAGLSAICTGDCEAAVHAQQDTQVALLTHRAAAGEVTLEVEQLEGEVSVTLVGARALDAAGEIGAGTMSLELEVAGRGLPATRTGPAHRYVARLPELRPGRHRLDARLRMLPRGEVIAAASAEVAVDVAPLDFGRLRAGDPPRCLRAPHDLEARLLESRGPIRLARDDSGAKLCASAPLGTLQPSLWSEVVTHSSGDTVRLHAQVEPRPIVLAALAAFAFLLGWLVFWLADVRPWRGRVTHLAVLGAADTAGFRDAARPRWSVRPLAEVEPELRAAGIGVERTTEGLALRADRPLVIARPSGRAWARTAAAPLRAWTVVHAPASAGTHTWLALDAREARRVAARALDPEIPEPETLRAWATSPVIVEAPSRAVVLGERTAMALVLAVLVGLVPWVTGESAEYGQTTPTLLAVAWAMVVLTAAFALPRLRARRTLLG